MNKTKIEWVKNPDGSQGYTWNPITGCLNGCDYCYARKLANGRLRSRYLKNKNTAPCSHTSFTHSACNNPFYPRFWPDRLTDPLHYNREGIIDYESSKGIFVCNMGELFGDWVPREWQDLIFVTINYCPNDRFYLLTKQPQNLEKFSPFPDNCWVGVSVTNKEQATEAGFWMRNVKAGLKFISFEPLLEYIPVTFHEFIEVGVQPVEWVIVGAQTKPHILPEDDWVREIYRSAKLADIPVFFKDNMRPKFIPLQEMP